MKIKIMNISASIRIISQLHWLLSRFVTRTTHSVEKFPLMVLAVITAVPPLIAVTIPLGCTCATSISELL